MNEETTSSNVGNDNSSNPVQLSPGEVPAQGRLNSVQLSPAEVLAQEQTILEEYGFGSLAEIESDLKIMDKDRKSVV